MAKAGQTLALWLAGRKFALLVAYWAFVFIGAAVLYFAEAADFEESLDVYNSALEWALYGFFGFAGIEGGKELADIVRGGKGRNPKYDPSTTDTVVG